MDEMNSTFDIEVSPKKENKEKQIQYKKYDKNKRNKEIVKEEIVEPVQQELESVTEEEEIKPVVEEPKLRDGWAKGVITNKRKTSVWVSFKNGRRIEVKGLLEYSVGDTVEFELPSWYKDLQK